MIDQLKKLQNGDMITIDHDSTREVAGSEDLSVGEVTYHELDDGEVVIVQLEDFVLGGYRVADLSRYFFYEVLDEGKGKTKYYRNEEFVKQIKIQTDTRTTFVISDECPLVTEDESIRFCQYNSESYYDSLMVVLYEKKWIIYMGFEIQEEQIII